MSVPAISAGSLPRIEMPLTSRLMAQPEAAGGPKKIDFASMLGQSVSEVNSLQQQATQSVHEMLTGGDVQQSEVFASVQKADMAFRMLLQVRNKLMQAYEEVNAIRI